jgi:tryptophan 2,3-dioxygenase
MAQKSAEETRLAAQKQADATIEEARQAALAERMASQQKLSEIRWDIERLRAERVRYADEFRTLLDRHQRELAHVIGLTVVNGEATGAVAGA